MRIPPELRRRIEEQDGVVTRSQLRGAGVTDAAITHAVRGSGAWQRVARGVYAVFTGPLQPRHRLRAALLRAGPAALVSGEPACRAYGLRYVPAHGRPVILVPATKQPSPTPFATIRRVALLPKTKMVAGMPTAGPERAVLDACLGSSSLRDIRAVLCESVQVGLTTPERLAEQLGGARWHGAALVRRTIDSAPAKRPGDR